MNKSHGSITHGHTTHSSQSKTYKAWADMKTRCGNKNAKNYHRYGGRGISVCERWITFEGFLRDMGEAPVSGTLDRKDNNGNYSLDNCRWINNKKNSQNMSVSKIWIINGVEYKSKSDAAEAFGVARSTIKSWCKGRIRDGRVKAPKRGCNVRLLY